MIFTIQFFWFAISGTVGFIVDISVLGLLKDSLGLYVARLCSFLCALFTTWLINRTFTFRTYQSNHSQMKELLVYVGLMLIGGIVNYGLYALLVSSYVIISTYPMFAVAAGSMAGMIINFFTSKFLLFRFKK